MHKRIVFEPQRKVANPFGFRSFQFREHASDQLRISVGHLRLGLIPDQGPFHHVLLRVGGAISWLLDPLDVRQPGKDSVAKKYSPTVSFANSRSSCPRSTA